MKLFGFKIERDNQDNLQTVVMPEQEGAIEATSAGGAFASYLNLEASAKSEADLIMKYREMIQYPECDLAVENIIQEAIITNSNKPPIAIDLTKTMLSDNIQKIVTKEFEGILKMMDFNNQSYDIFKRWYVEGRLYYHCMIDPQNTNLGIQEIRIVDSLKIKKIREYKKTRDGQDLVGAKIFQPPAYEEYFVFNEKG